MRILVILTGGTIGSAKKDGYVALEPSRLEDLLVTAQQQHGEKLEFCTVTPFTMHSENLSAERLSALIQCLCTENLKGYDGVIVTHGTDTLQYSAAAAAFCLGSAPLPVVFVSSNHPLENPRANGTIHFEAAVAFINAGVAKGVYIAYSNDLRSVDFHYADRVFAHPELSDAVFSVGKPPFCYQNGRIVSEEDAILPPIGTGVGAVRFCERPRILELTVTPSLTYDYDPTDYSAVLLRPYHSGTLPTARTDFADFCRRFTDAGVPIFLPDVPSSTPYDSMREYDRLGVIALTEMAQIPLLIKLWIGVSLQQALVPFVQKSLVHKSAR